jgi:drug/metabolite transporter (DMT)-like permease
VRDLSKAVGIILGLAGVIWILQGIDVEFAPQSFMTGDPVWVILGVVAVMAGGVFLWRGVRRK